MWCSATELSNHPTLKDIEVSSALLRIGGGRHVAVGPRMLQAPDGRAGGLIAERKQDVPRLNADDLTRCAASRNAATRALCCRHVRGVGVPRRLRTHASTVSEIGTYPSGSAVVCVGDPISDRAGRRGRRGTDPRRGSHGCRGRRRVGSVGRLDRSDSRFPRILSANSRTSIAEVRCHHDRIGDHVGVLVATWRMTAAKRSSTQRILVSSRC
jgi:hypothetical protein